MKLNSLKQKHRNTVEKELDKKFASDMWKRGYSIRDIARLIEEYHVELKNPYSLNFVTISRDLKEVIKEAKKLREKAGINDLDDLVIKTEHIYNKALSDDFLSPNPGYLNTASKQIELLAKLKGLAIEKSEVTIKYDVEIC